FGHRSTVLDGQFQEFWGCPEFHKLNDGFNGLAVLKKYIHQPFDGGCVTGLERAGKGLDGGSEDFGFGFNRAKSWIHRQTATHIVPFRVFIPLGLFDIWIHGGKFSIELGLQVMKEKLDTRMVNGGTLENQQEALQFALGALVA